MSNLAKFTPTEGTEKFTKHLPHSHVSACLGVAEFMGPLGKAKMAAVHISAVHDISGTKHALVFSIEGAKALVQVINTAISQATP